jgi:hypothetical protein
VSRLNRELVQISISHEDQRQSLEEQEASCWRKKCTQRQSHSKPKKAGFARAESK